MMQGIYVLTEDEVFEKGIEFDGDIVCFSGIYGQQVYNRPMEEGGEPVTGLVYEKYSNGCINYYCYYENGIKHGEYLSFYESSKIKKYCIMQNGQIFGESIEWFESGCIRAKECCKYGVVISFEKWDEKGVLINRKTEPNEAEKKIIAKYDSIYG